jgi:hypothetical protein
MSVSDDRPVVDPRGEHPGRPGTTWETRLVVETVIPDDVPPEPRHPPRHEAKEAPPMSPKLLTLATPCAVCPHPYNWHTPGGCQADDGTNHCSCRAFAVAADQEQQPARHTADTITDNALDELYAERDELRQRFHNQAHAATELIEQLGTTEAERDELRGEITSAQNRLADMARSRNEWQWRAEDADRRVRIQRERADKAEAEVTGARATIDHMSTAMSWICGHDRQGLDHLEEAQREAHGREAAVRQARAWAERARSAEAAIDRVRKLHQRWDASPADCAHCITGSSDLVPWPCPTIQALDTPEQ